MTVAQIDELRRLLHPNNPAGPLPHVVRELVDMVEELNSRVHDLEQRFIAR